MPGGMLNAQHEVIAGYDHCSTYLIWPDSGLTRNTRALGYRCSVPGLAGFTGAALCGARSLITCQKRLRS